MNIVFSDVFNCSVIEGKLLENCKVTATDKDRGKFGNVTYSILSNNKVCLTSFLHCVCPFNHISVSLKCQCISECPILSLH